jgi:hypothetical protein
MRPAYCRKNQNMNPLLFNPEDDQSLLNKFEKKGVVRKKRTTP